jgi:hypothetical protein
MKEYEYYKITLGGVSRYVRRIVESDDFEYDSHPFEIYDSTLKYWNYWQTISESVWKDNEESYTGVTEEEVFLEMI